MSISFLPDKVQLLNDYFHSVFSTFTGTIKCHVSIYVRFFQFSDSDVLNWLTILDTSKACSIDYVLTLCHTIACFNNFRLLK